MNRKAAAAMATLCGLVSACDRLGLSQSNEAMALLKKGAPAVCANASVQDTLASVLRPEIEDATDDSSADLIQQLKYRFDTTTLEDFKRDLSKATCATRVVARVGDRESRRFPVTFVISPSAEDPDSFVIETANGLGRTISEALVAAALADLKNRQDAEAFAAEESVRKAKVLRVVNGRWLLGTWREYSPNWGGEFSCETDAYAFLDFERTGRFGAYNESGSWRLAENRLAVRAASFDDNGAPNPARNYELTIIDADGREQLITVRDEDGAVTTYRRCPKAPVAAPIEAPAAAPAPATPPEQPPPPEADELAKNLAGM